MSYRTTLVLLVILALLGLFVYLYQVQGIGRPKEEEIPILTFTQDEIARIEVAKEGKKVVMVKGEDDLWRMTEPEPGEGNQERMEEITSVLDSLKADLLVEKEAKDLAQYGLAEAAAEVTIAAKGGRAAILLIGKKTLLDVGYYVKLKEADAVYVANWDPIGRLIGMADVYPILTPTPTETPPGWVEPTATATALATPTVTATPLASPTPTATPRPAS